MSRRFRQKLVLPLLVLASTEPYTGPPSPTVPGFSPSEASAVLLGRSACTTGRRGHALGFLGPSLAVPRAETNVRWQTLSALAGTWGTVAQCWRTARPRVQLAGGSDGMGTCLKAPGIPMQGPGGRQGSLG